MVELKTLKDLTHKCSCDCGLTMQFRDTAHIEELRDEAIKWVKELKEAKSKCDSSFDEQNWPIKNNCPNWIEIEDDGYYSHCECGRYSNPQIEWIKHFFNITDEDLKPKNE